MPNHVKNVLKFSNLKPKDVDFILKTIATQDEDAELPADKDTEYKIDFDKIIPEPKTEEECPDEYKVNKDSHIMEYEDRPWFDWYKWHNAFWDTKWNAYDCYTKVGKSYITFVFSTAWSMPYNVMTRLHLLGYDFELRYADEDWGNNCGILMYSSEHGFTHYDEDDMIAKRRNAQAFARDLWNRY